MFLRATIVAGSTAALLALAGGGTAHASCLDDATGRSVTEGYSLSPKSPYWMAEYVAVSGTANVEVHGDALVSDYAEFAVTDMPNYTTIVAENSVDITTTFVDCVAG